ncbi:MAG: phage holin family protein [Blautia sp.]|jgi:toxin secretion/phage lysis holin|uniref:phage holin family protein n=1 Tax=Blautia sp. TaxID=1955243 RepID=UPI002A74EE4E|nr:phage holin family protein [Blautia sp.]MDY3017605.1 phage holin family protein [Blautia sp.]
MKYKIFTTLALAGSALAELFGGWDMALETLLILMAADWITGGLLLPAVFGKSPKSPNGALESRAGWKGLCRKGMTLFYILIAARMDRLLGMDYIRNAVCIGFIANELLSIVENAGLMGVPLPAMIRKVIDILKENAEKEAA